MYPNRRGLERKGRTAGALLALLLATPAWAHDADVIYVLANEREGGVEEVVTITPGTLSQLAPIDADGDGALSQADLDARAAAIAAGVWDQIPIDGCTRSGEAAQLHEGYVELSAAFACPNGPLSQDFKILRVLTTNYRVVLGRQADAQTGRAFAQGNVQRLDLRPGPSQPAATSTLGFRAGALSPLLWADVTLVFLLSLLAGASARAAALRWAVLVLAHAAVALAGLRAPELGGALIVAGVGSAFVLQLLAGGTQKWPLGVLGLLGAGEALREHLGSMGLDFQAGRAVGLLALTALGLLLALALAPRPALKRRAVLAVGCATLAALGFSLVQTVRTF